MADELDSSGRYGEGTPLFTASKYPPGRGLQNSLWLPFGFLYTPLATPQTIASSKNVLLCRTCLAHASIYSRIEGTKWECALCGCVNRAESPEDLEALTCATMEFRKPLALLSCDNLVTAETLIVVLDANLPAHEARGVGKAIESLLIMNNNYKKKKRKFYLGLVVFSDVVSVYQLESSPGNMAIADVFQGSGEMTTSQLETRPYLFDVSSCYQQENNNNNNNNGSTNNDAMDAVWQCLSAVYGVSMDGSSSSSRGDGDDENRDGSNNNNNKPMSRLEMLKQRKQERMRMEGMGRRKNSNKAEAAAKSPWVAAKEERRKQPAVRCTGEALQIALDLVPDDSQGRLLLFTNGCPNKGQASIVNSSNPNEIDALRVTNVSEYLEVLAKSATEGDNIGIDVLLMGSGELGMPIFASLCEPSAGYALVHDSFATPKLMHNLSHIFQGTRLIPVLKERGENADGANKIPDGCVVDVRIPNFLDPTHIVGPGDLLEESGLLTCEQEAFDKSQSLSATTASPNSDFISNTTTRIRLGRHDPLATFSIMLQANDFHQKDSYAFFQFVVRYVEDEELVTRVTSHRLSMAHNSGEFLDSVDEEVVAVVLGKEAVYRSMYGREMTASDEPPPTAAGDYLRSLAADAQKDLDATIHRISGAYRLLRLETGNRGFDTTEGNTTRSAGSSIDVTFPPELADALLRLYYLRRNPLLSPGPMKADDDRAQLRSLFLRMPLSDCLCMMAPSLWTSGAIDGQLCDSTQLGPVRPETLALWEDTIIAADYYHSLFVWSGKVVTDQQFNVMRESVTDFLKERTKNRFPMPDFHILNEGDSMERRFTALLAPSHGDPVEHQLINFPALAELQPDTLQRLRSKFSFYDKHVDPSFREWFWGVVGAVDDSKDSVMTLCE